MTDIFIASKKHEGREMKHEDDSTVKLFTTFSHDPKGISFQTQKEKEVIILFLRSHFIKTLPWLITTAILIVIPLIALPLLFSLKFDFIPIDVLVRFTIIATLFYYSLVFSYAFVNLMHWFYNVFIVTSERIVDIDYYNIVVHNIAITSLSHVQDVNYTQSGFIPTFLNYGNLFVQTAGDEVNFEAFSVPKPREATHIIGDLTGRKP